MKTGDVALDLVPWQVVTSAGVRLAEIAADDEGAQARWARPFACATLSPPTTCTGATPPTRSKMTRAMSPTERLSISARPARRASDCR